jgi:hypothetical protein
MLNVREEASRRVIERNRYDPNRYAPPLTPSLDYLEENFGDSPAERARKRQVYENFLRAQRRDVKHLAYTVVYLVPCHVHVK